MVECLHGLQSGHGTICQGQHNASCIKHVCLLNALFNKHVYDNLFTDSLCGNLFTFFFIKTSSISCIRLLRKILVVLFQAKIN